MRACARPSTRRPGDAPGRGWRDVDELSSRHPRRCTGAATAAATSRPPERLSAASWRRARRASPEASMRACARTSPRRPGDAPGRGWRRVDELPSRDADACSSTATPCPRSRNVRLGQGRVCYTALKRDIATGGASFVALAMLHLPSLLRAEAPRPERQRGRRKALGQGRPCATAAKRRAPKPALLRAGAPRPRQTDRHGVHVDPARWPLRCLAVAARAPAMHVPWPWIAGRARGLTPRCHGVAIACHGVAINTVEEG